MSNLCNVGNLINLYLDDLSGVEIEATTEIVTAAKILQNNGGRNWVPILVIEIGVDQYQVIDNSFVYSVCKLAKLKKVWCIIVPNKPGAKQIVNNLYK